MTDLLNVLPALISSVLALVILGSVVVSVHVFQDELDSLERFLWAGLGGSMLLTTPALWIHGGTPFDGWAFNVSRTFLTALCIKRLVIPVLWKWQARKRDAEQIRQSGARMVDRWKHRL